MKKLIESENEEELKKQTCYLIEPYLTLKMIQLNNNNINQPKIFYLFIYLFLRLKY